MVKFRHFIKSKSITLIAAIVVGLAIAIASFAPKMTPAPPPRWMDIAESKDPSLNDNNLYDGYWWHGGWVPGMISLNTFYTPAPTLTIGSATFYGPGVMEATAQYRGLSLAGYIGGVALMSPADIGSDVWIKRPGATWEGPFLVVDCAERDDQYAIIVHRGEVIEVDFSTAKRWGMAWSYRTGDGTWSYHVLQWKIEDVIVSKRPPKRLSLNAVVDYVDWYKSIVTYTR